MQFVILGAGKSNNYNLPHSLLKIDTQNDVLEYQLEQIKKIKAKTILIGGYKILDIMEKYPQINFIYNKNWEKTRTLYSLSLMKNIDNDILVSYGDILFNNQILKKLLQNKTDIVFAIDTLWKSRYEGRDYAKAEIVYKNKEKFTLGRYNNQNNIIGEFIGLVKFPRNIATKLNKYINEALKNIHNDGIIDVLNIMIKSDIKCSFIDIKGNWSEVDSLQDIEHFQFGTKAETLNRLKLKLKKSKILEQYTFTIKQFQKNNEKIINDIQNKFESILLVVRSSALNEDTKHSSMAGNYESILKVKKNDKNILNVAINKVIKSYEKNNQKQNINNQILVQPYLENTNMSGVAFSKNLQKSSPYYIVNYNESSDTEAVTSGNKSELNTLICYNDFTHSIQNKKLAILITAIKEIENITKYDAIDIEFAFVDTKLYILQVRPIAANKDSIIVDKNDILYEINSIKSSLTKQNIDLLGSQKAFGVMPDWNPAEIIGINPKPLSFDIYKYIITDNIWAKSRKLLGYRNVKNNAGLISFAGKPYVDIKMSFNTFIPKTLNSNLASKLIDYFINKLQKNPELHDKVEFQIAITSYDFAFDSKILELKSNGFTSSECSQIKEAYKKLTEDIVLEKHISIESDMNKIILLTKKRENILALNIDSIDKIYLLLQECKLYGTLPFSNLARFAFIGSIFLKSLLSNKVIETLEYDNFFKSIHTVAKDFIYDFNLLISKKITKNEFILKYGHLRPGTYDITSLSYHDGFDNYIDFNADINEIKNDKFKFSKKTFETIEKEIKKHHLPFDAKQLLDFTIKAIETREKAKFEFTKNISAILDLIINIGDKYNLNKEELSYLNLYELLKYRNSTSKIYLESDLRKSILKNKKQYLLTSAILLPELIFSQQDIEMFFYPSSKPNFISHNKIESEIVLLKNDNNVSINDKIVLIENADPGFDWIFSHNIKGLVTKYGGVASHMAIRCAEFNLPAAIGCGDKIFNNLRKYNKIVLDCINYKVKGIS